MLALIQHIPVKIDGRVEPLERNRRRESSFAKIEDGEPSVLVLVRSYQRPSMAPIDIAIHIWQTRA